MGCCSSNLRTFEHSEITYEERIIQFFEQSLIFSQRKLDDLLSMIEEIDFCLDTKHLSQLFIVMKISETSATANFLQNLARNNQLSISILQNLSILLTTVHRIPKISLFFSEDKEQCIRNIKEILTIAIDLIPTNTENHENAILAYVNDLKTAADEYIKEINSYSIEKIREMVEGMQINSKDIRSKMYQDIKMKKHDGNFEEKLYINRERKVIIQDKESLQTDKNEIGCLIQTEKIQKNNNKKIEELLTVDSKKDNKAEIKHDEIHESNEIKNEIQEIEENKIHEDEENANKIPDRIELIKHISILDKHQELSFEKNQELSFDLNSSENNLLNGSLTHDFAQFGESSFLDSLDDKEKSVENSIEIKDKSSLKESFNQESKESQILSPRAFKDKEGSKIGFKKDLIKLNLSSEDKESSNIVPKQGDISSKIPAEKKESKITMKKESLISPRSANIDTKSPSKKEAFGFSKRKTEQNDFKITKADDLPNDNDLMPVSYEKKHDINELSNEESRLLLRSTSLKSTFQSEENKNLKRESFINYQNAKEKSKISMKKTDINKVNDEVKDQNIKNPIQHANSMKKESKISMNKPKN